MEIIKLFIELIKNIIRKNNLIFILYVDIKRMSKNITTLILKQMYPVLENIVEQIAEGENLDKDELKKKYLSGELKEYKKKRSRTKGVVNGYSVFLSDKDINEKILKENPDSSFGERSKIKGKMWGDLPEQEKEKYKKQAQDLNNKKKSDKSSEESE